MSQHPFTEEVGSYTVLRLILSEYRPSARVLPDGFRIAGSEERPALLAQEKDLLRRTFEDWEIPYRGKLAGWRDESPIYSLCNAMLVGGLYLCAGNEFDDDKNWGQLHYFFVAPEFRGRGLHSVLVKEAVGRAVAWGLEGVYINTDRAGLPEVYVRWGAKVWKQIPKPTRLPRNNVGRLLRRMRWLTRALLQKRQMMT